MDYLTIKDVDEIYTLAISEQEELGSFKQRGKGRVYTKHETDVYITDTYIRHICALLRILLKKGNYSKSRIVEHLRNYDWEYHSFASKAFSEESLYNALMLKPKKSDNVVPLLLLQTKYLRRAAEIVSGYIEYSIKEDK